MEKKQITGNESIEELELIIDSANNTYIEMKKEYELFLKASAREKEPKIKPTKKQEKNITSTTNETTVILDEETQYYYNEFMGLKLNELKTDYLSTLPSIKNERYCNIINRILLQLNLILKDWYACIQELELKKEEYEAAREEIKNIYARRRLLIDAFYQKDDEDEDQETENIENQLLFLKTDAGNTQAIEEINGIDKSFYERIASLLNSIKDGTFKDVKRLTENDKVKGIPEVRAYQVRVVFERISSNQYVIISIFTKKTNSDKAYRQNLETKISNYKKNKDVIKKICKNPEYIEENLDIDTKIFELLESRCIKKW